MLREVQSNDLIALCSVEGLSHPDNGSLKKKNGNGTCGETQA